MTTAAKVVKIARSQIGVKESPAGSNRTKYGADFGMNGETWCAIFAWWCGWKASDEDQSKNPFPKSASAANIQDVMVSSRGGSWVMPKSRSKDKRESMCRQALPGDSVSFDFGAYDAFRDHTGIIDHIEGDYVICIEGNTSGSGSQWNGGMVCKKRRHYSEICAVARPAYAKPKPYKNTKEMAVDGDFGYQTIYRMQRWLGVKVDGDIGKNTIKALQERVGTKQDGLWGHGTTKRLQEFLGVKADGDFGKKTIEALQAHLNNVIASVPDSRPKTKKTTKLDKICKLCEKCAWPKGTSRKIYGYPNGKRRKAYVKALNKSFKDRSGWRHQTRVGTSCDVAVAVIIRASGIDKLFPRGCDDIMKYLASSRGRKKWKCLKEKHWKKWKPGTVIFQQYKTGGKHIFIYFGHGLVFNAHYVKRIFPIIEKASKIVKPESSCKYFKVFVPRSVQKK